MTYRSVVATRFGPPAVLQVTEHELRAPKQGEVRIKVWAAAVSRPDISARAGTALYHGTPLGQKVPFTPGYAIVGTVDSCGDGVQDVQVGDRVGVLCVVGGYTEYLYWRSDRLIPVPETVDPAEGVTLILNYLVAYQALHRVAKARPSECALIIGASGGIGTALLQLGRLANLTLYGIASTGKLESVAALGATPIDYQKQEFVAEMRKYEPDGLDIVFDGMMRMGYIQGSLSLLRRGGRLVSFGEPESLGALGQILMQFAATNLTPNGKSFKLYGTSNYFLFDRRPFLEDWATLFRLLETGEIAPVIARKYSILGAAAANELLESGQFTGNVVLVAPEFLECH